MASASVYMILDRRFRAMCATGCLGVDPMTVWADLFPWELRMSLKCVFYAALPNKPGDILPFYQPFTLNRFKSDSEVLLQWSRSRTEDCISFAFQTLIGKGGGRSQYNLKPSGPGMWCKICISGNKT